MGYAKGMGSSDLGKISYLFTEEAFCIILLYAKLINYTSCAKNSSLTLHKKVTSRHLLYLLGTSTKEREVHPLTKLFFLIQGLIREVWKITSTWSLWLVSRKGRYQNLDPS